MNKLSGFLDFSTKKSMELILAKIPTEKPWEIFAWVPFGGWNECPDIVDQGVQTVEVLADTL